MLYDVVYAEPREGYHLFVRFDDGSEGEIDISKYVKFRGVFAGLNDIAVFRQVRVDPELGTVVWPGGGDLDPTNLHSHVTGKPIVLRQHAS